MCAMYKHSLLIYPKATMVLCALTFECNGSSIKNYENYRRVRWYARIWHRDSGKVHTKLQQKMEINALIDRQTPP